MERPLLLLFLMLLLLLLTFFSHCSSSAAMPMCASGAPVVVLPEPLPFCVIVGPSCCDPAADAALGEEFRAMNVPESDTACATIVRAILCEKCIPSPSPQQPAVNDVTIRSIPPRCASPRTSSAPPQPQQDAVCLERLAGGGTAASYKGMAAHPDGSGRAFLYTQDGKIWIASVPARGSGAPMQVAPFVDLTGRALQLLGLAPHPEFATNCRFFISYACDAIASPACAAGTSSSPAAAAGGYAGSSKPWRYQLVVEEFTARNVGYGMADRAAPTEVRRIFTMGLPQPVDDASNQQHGGGGQIFFRPGHGYLYLVTGHGGAGDEDVTSPFLGKIIRFDVGRSPGNEPQIFATGIRDPRGCSFDSKRPSYLYCAAVDEQQNQQVYLISNKASNYSASPAAAKAAVSVIAGHGRPTAGEAPSIIGGIVYRGPADPFLSGRYLYMYGSSMWAAAAGTPAPASNALRVYVRCSGSSAVPCGGVAIAGGIVSLAQDNSEDAFIIATGGIYRVIPPGLCGGAPRPRARAPPLQNNAATSWLVWAASILVSAVTAPSAIYLGYLCLCGRRRGEGEREEGDGGDPTATNSHEVTLICCFRGILTNFRNNAPPPTGSQVELVQAPV